MSADDLGPYVEIPLTKGKVALVSPEDYERVTGQRWRLMRSGNTSYAFCTEEGKTVYMHRLIAEPQADARIDHRNGNGLDNRRANLRTATQSQNMCNRGRPSNNKTGFKGVHWDRAYRRFRASIRCGGSGIKLGRFATAEEAARAYDAAARELHGEFARLNFPDAEVPRV